MLWLITSTAIELFENIWKSRWIPAFAGMT